MADIHIDEFYHDIGLTLSRLYASFPRRCTIYVEDIAGADRPDEFGLHSERFLSGFSALLWLKDCDYIAFDSVIRQEAIDQAVLSEKSFLVLSSRAGIMPCDDDVNLDELPASVSAKAMSNIHLLRQALLKQSSSEVNRVVLHIMEQARALKA